ncbi:MAG: PAS domain-containing protein [Pseudohongiellaceae bacterium]|nr:PAS domain-containing protein [Pseudohongiellaceae bacterium]
MPNDKYAINSYRAWYAISLIGLGVVFLIDFLTPLGFAHGTLYTFFVLTASLTQNARFVMGIAISSILLTFIGSLVSPPGFTLVYVAANRIISCITIAITAFVVALAIRKIKAIRAISHDLRTAITRSDANEALLKIASRISQVGGWVAHLAGSPEQPDPDGEPLLSWSAEVCRIHGVPTDFEPTVEKAVAFLVPEHREHIADAVRRCIIEGIAYDQELQIIRADGQRAWVRIIGEAVRNDQGRTVRIQGAYQDLTWERRLSDEVFESQRRFQQFTNSLPLIVWTATPSGYVDFVSNAFNTYTGNDTNELINEQEWLKRIHPDDEEHRVNDWKNASSELKDFTTEFRIRSATGEYRWFLIYGRPIFNAEHEVVKWYGAAIDIHDKKLLEEELRTSEQRLSYLTAATTDAVWDWDSVNQKLWWSDSLYTLFGYEPEEKAPTPEDWAKRIHPEDRNNVVPGLQHAIDGDSSDWEAEYRYKRADGTYAYVSDRCTVIRDEEGNAVRTVGGMRDVSSRRNMIEQIQQADRLHSVGQLTGGVAHDFNNLLTVILGNSELLVEGLNDNKNLQSLAIVSRDAAQRGSQLTQRLLAFARRQALEPKAVDIPFLLKDMESLLRRTLRENIDIEIVNAAGLWQALVDPAQLEGALLNLSLNAKDAMPEGGKLTIETGNAYLDDKYAESHNEVKSGQYVLIAVSDTGEGIDEEHLSQVFDPFFSTKGLGKGTGLGLSMVYGFVKQSNGHINIYSEVDQGTTVKIYLPRCTDTKAPEPHNITEPTTGGTERILAVEDDELVRDFVCNQLLVLGYKVLSAANAEEALKILRSDEKIDLLFTDIVMPGELNGRQLADEAQKLRPGLKVLYTSGYTENAIVHQGRLDPGVHLLSKPYRRNELAQKIRLVLKGE